MSLIGRIRKFAHDLRNPQPIHHHEPTPEQKEEITRAIPKQRFYGDLPGRRQYPD
ncbi:MAG: hypothetical protein WCE80_00430 [Acidimicrobiia bacterium]